MFPKKPTIILALVGMLLFTGGAAWALEIVYPADKTFFARSNFLIIKGGSEPPLEGITIDVDGAKSDIIDIGSPEYRAAFQDFLILEPDFEPGKNVIQVEGFAGGKKVATARAEVYYLDSDLTAQPPAGFKPFIMHRPESEAKCAPCHNMASDKVEQQLTTAVGNPCASCHSRMLNRSHVHGPAGVYRCTYCHQADSRPNRYQPRNGDGRICNECHIDKVKAFNANKFVHGPVAAGICLVCHDPHASDNTAQLLAPINTVCLNCHEEIGKSTHVVRGVTGKGHPLQGVPDPSRPGVTLSCASCHDPHGGAGKDFFRRGITSRFALCQMCHQK
jgi:predicted CXXCH cytochrome family protein